MFIASFFNPKCPSTHEWTNCVIVIQWTTTWQLRREWLFDACNNVDES